MMGLTKKKIEQIESELVTVSNPFLSSHPDKDVAIEKYYRAQLMVLIRNIFLEKGLSPSKAADLLGVKQPRISELVNGKVSAFSVEKLLIFLYKLGVQADFSTLSEDSKIVVSYS